MKSKNSYKSKLKNIEIFFDREGIVPLPPNIRPVIILKGSDYELGYQWYQQLIQIFGKWILENISGKQWNSEQLKAIEIYEKYIKEYTPEWIEMMKGMAKGASDAGVPLSYQDVLAYMNRGPYQDVLGYMNRGPEGMIHGATDLVVYPSASTKTVDGSQTLGCSGFVAWGKATTDGRLVAMGNTDHELMAEVTIVVFPEDGGNRFITSPFYATMGPTGGHPGLNSKGLVNVHHAATRWIGAKPVSERTYGVREGLAIWHTLRFANNSDEALEMQLSYPSGDGYIGSFWADTNGNAFAIERNHPPIIRRAGDYGETDFLYSTNNALSKELGYAQNPPLEGNIYVEHGGWLGTGVTISSILRNLWLWNFLDSYKGQINLEFAMMMMRFPGLPPDYPSLEKADSVYYSKKGEGWHIAPGNLLNPLVGVMLPSEGLYYVTNRAVRKGYPHGVYSEGHYPSGANNPLDSRHFYDIEPIHSFYELKLTSDFKVSDVAFAARKKAHYSMYYANQELRKLSYRDVPYVPLDEVFNEAAVEWQRGRYYIEFAQKAHGNDSVYKWAKALRAYTRCQALANHVFESLIPPPTTPMDLGLKKAKFLEDSGF